MREKQFASSSNLQEWQNSGGSALSVVDASGKLGVGIAAPVRQIHLQGNNAVFRMDRDANSSIFMLVRTAAGDFSTIWKTFYVGVNASGANDGSFFIGDAGANVSGPSTVRLAIGNSGNVGVGTESPSSKLHVISDSGIVGETGITVDIPGIGVRRIIIGAPDSAGTGYRTLKVGN